jgi:hypothetical protein
VLPQLIEQPSRQNPRRHTWFCCSAQRERNAAAIIRAEIWSDVKVTFKRKNVPPSSGQKYVINAPSPSGQKYIIWCVNQKFRRNILPESSWQKHSLVDGCITFSEEHAASISKVDTSSYMDLSCRYICGKRNRFHFQGRTLVPCVSANTPQESIAFVFSSEPYSDE